jgi:hypothetical protein
MIASYSVGTGSSFPRGKSGRGVKLTTHLQLVRGQENLIVKDNLGNIAHDFHLFGLG